ncbi:hypothetical protein OIU84_008455, partial [Salix udensis]
MMRYRRLQKIALSMGFLIHKLPGCLANDMSMRYSL